jgi:hypothetical protein
MSKVSTCNYKFNGNILCMIFDDVTKMTNDNKQLEVFFTNCVIHRVNWGKIVFAFNSTAIFNYIGP